MPADRTQVLRVLVVVPAWNEEATVADTIAALTVRHPDYDVLVVDDGSTDATAAKAAAAGALVCQLPFNLGVGGAMRAGYRYALRHEYDVAAQVDADGQHDPDFLPAMISRLDEADIVIGARFAGAGTTRSGCFAVWP
jgi:glycosyltransferase involved in cell wall biosynthesis